MTKIQPHYNKRQDPPKICQRKKEKLPKVQDATRRMQTKLQPYVCLLLSYRYSYRFAVADCITHQTVQRHSCSAFARFVLGLKLHTGARGVFSIVYPDPTGVHPWRRMEDGVGWGSATGLFAVVFGSRISTCLSNGEKQEAARLKLTG